MKNDYQSLSKEELITTLDALQNDHNRVLSNHISLLTAQKAFLTEHASLQSTHKAFLTEHISLQTAHEALKHDFSKLRFEMDQLIRLVHGAKNERYIATSPASGQLSLLDIPAKESSKSTQVVVPSHQRNKVSADKPSRNILPSHLERITKTIFPEGFDESSKEKPIGEEVTEVLNYIPGKLVVEQTIRPKFKTPQGDIIIAELPNRPFGKGLFGIALIVRILIDKYVDHLPLHRQRQRFKRLGLEIAESTLGDVPRQVAKLMELLYQELIRQVLESGYLNVDETPTPVLDSNKKGKTHRGYHWAYLAPQSKLLFFDYRPGRGREGPDILLDQFKGFLQTDGYSLYNAYARKNGITLVGCMAHARRYFEQSLNSDAERAGHIMELIQQVYAIERKIDQSPTSLNPEQIIVIRQQQALPVLNQIKQWLDEHLNIVTPTSPLGKAIAYMHSRWEKLTHYLLHAELRIDNNLVENAIRPLVLGRKNSLFSGSHDGAKRSAMMYSFLGSCKVNGINPEEWLADVLEKLPETKSSQLYTLLPNYWKSPQ